MGSDAPDFEPTLRAAVKRNPRARRVLADAGYDSHDNHRIAREELGVQSLIKTGCGRPYGQRAQAETVHSMIKRNLGDHLRCRTPARRNREMALRAVVHNIMVIRRAPKGLNRAGRFLKISRTDPVSIAHKGW